MKQNDIFSEIFQAVSVLLENFYVRSILYLVIYFLFLSFILSFYRRCFICRERRIVKKEDSKQEDSKQIFSESDIK